mmetsp:Transcript_23272/g.51081  ORF Transcript_23272/g.51081 Transcript_23272/m.51081 type:complete len:341 (-) Transcript_23272:184-1206(-)|eukprot:CAMPEP_0206420714 /NCGR_PEP_ID=MMETSP0324_2-20121206/1020_1 /ASSEMBLY_ACC=CAM_ASM_000836 /TAXON_ID=2866 /ORGANISM="Crypthecodinium cohnii, Strain Seligo" /LENGTH=340 /DNA_ID=CAMNT_0053884677 /DNA_START=34 /DNA_END=1056 /DNA_ORIENTATION=+
MAAPSISGLQPLPAPCLPQRQGQLMGVADNSWQAFLGEKDIEEDLTECIAAWQEGHASVSVDYSLARGIGRHRNELGSSMGSVGGPASSSSTFKRPGPVITLNVGGRIFRTTESTLRKAPFFESMLRHSEEGSIGTTRDPDGHPFVDRCGDLFPYVLEYLRCGHWLLGERQNDMEFVTILRAEAEFFGLDGSGDAVLPWCRVSEYVMVWQFRDDTSLYVDCLESTVREDPDHQGLFRLCKYSGGLPLDQQTSSKRFKATTHSIQAVLSYFATRGFNLQNMLPNAMITHTTSADGQGRTGVGTQYILSRSAPLVSLQPTTPMPVVNGGMTPSSNHVSRFHT